MAKSRRPLIGALCVTAMLLGLAGSGVFSPSAANAEGAPVASQSNATGSAAARCLTWRRSSPTKAYDNGRTAGYSWAWNKVVGPSGPGGTATRVNRVKEIQCLLDYRGFDAFLHEGSQGDIADSPWGYYHLYTSQAVSQAQSFCEIPNDGVVGPATWRCLRRDSRW